MSKGNSMPFPKFKVGEVVILESGSHPQFNGEYTIHGISDTRDKNNTYRYKGIYYEFGSSPRSMFAYHLGEGS